MSGLGKQLKNGLGKGTFHDCIREKVVREFDSKVVAEKYIELYENVKRER